MLKLVDLELRQLKEVLRRAEQRLAWMNRSVLDASALKAAEDLCEGTWDLVATASECALRPPPGTVWCGAGRRTRGWAALLSSGVVLHFMTAQGAFGFERSGVWIS